MKDMIESPLEKWHRIVLAQQPDGLDDLLADEVVFYSPIVHTPQRGKALVKRYLSAALQVFFNPSLRCVRKLCDDSNGVFEFEVDIDGILLNVMDVLRWDERGRVVEFRVFIRPLKAMQLAQQRMAAMLERSE
jgi:hypothetical protein